jgi:hypothetical protein
LATIQVKTTLAKILPLFCRKGTPTHHKLRQKISNAWKNDELYPGMAFASPEDMGLLLLIGILLSPTAQSQGCSEDNCSTDLQKVLSVAPSIQSESAPGMSLSDRAFENTGLRPEVFARAKTAFEKAWLEGKTRKTVYTIIDYELASDKKRMWIIDMNTGKLLYNEYVSHGKNSGGKTASRMSNVDNSKASNVGLMKTAETYNGKHGFSLKLDGLEKGFNDNARSRYIVIHGANYASPGFVASQGRTGRSWGCPAIDPAVTKEIIEKIKGGSLIFGHFPDTRWLGNSRYLN